MIHDYFTIINSISLERAFYAVSNKETFDPTACICPTTFMPYGGDAMIWTVMQCVTAYFSV